MIISILGLIDIIAGIILIVGGLPYFQGSSLVFGVAVLMIIKGIWSWLTNIASPQGLNLDPMGILDIITGLLLFLVISGVFFSIFALLGVLVIIKGVYSFVVGLVK
jgi:hypothetical protein